MRVSASSYNVWIVYYKRDSSRCVLIRIIVSLVSCIVHTNTVMSIRDREMMSLSIHE